ncbi:hypothetical protein niasHT_028571 [Heterodera trifolii]|uniref:14-3-3 domain-containing protein n=1 Tax=Heterodera trifolii TaxID=157864 RepID=A0ABD2JPB8_9BILA
MGEQRDELVQRAKLAEQAERYDDMAKAMKKLVEMDAKLDEEERNLLSIAYRKAVGARRTSRRIINSAQHRPKLTEKQKGIADALKKEVEHDMEQKGREALDLLDKILIPKVDEPVAKVTYLRMKADFHRYMAEIKEAENDDLHKAKQSYEEAWDIAQQKIRPSHPIRLGVALNFAVFLHEFMKMPEEGRKLAQKAHDDGNADLLADTSGESYLESIGILEKLDDNLRIWAATQQQDGSSERGNF